jgi:hypothetical protein
VSWRLRIPHRDRHEALDAKSIWELPRALNDPDERAVAREYLVVIRTCGGRTVGQALDVIESCDTADRRLFLDGCRKLAGLPLTKEVDDKAAYERVNAAGRACGNPFLQRCHHPDCDRVPLTETGSLAETKVRRWHCAEHAHLAQPGDLEDRPPPWRYSPSGAIVEVNEAEKAREAAAAKSRRRQLEEQAAERKVEAAERRQHQQAIADETRRLVPPGVPA